MREKSKYIVYDSSNGGNALRRLGTQESMLAAVVMLNLATFVVAMVAGVLFGFDRFFFVLLTAVVLFAVATVSDAVKQLPSKNQKRLT